MLKRVNYLLLLIAGRDHQPSADGCEGPKFTPSCRHSISARLHSNSWAARILNIIFQLTSMFTFESRKNNY